VLDPLDLFIFIDLNLSGCGKYFNIGDISAICFTPETAVVGKLEIAI